MKNLYLLKTALIIDLWSALKESDPVVLKIAKSS